MVRSSTQELLVSPAKHDGKTDGSDDLAHCNECCLHIISEPPVKGERGKMLRRIRGQECETSTRSHMINAAKRMLDTRR
jgi:hypothetical protein